MRRLAALLLPFFMLLSSAIMVRAQQTQSFNTTAPPIVFNATTTTGRVPFPSPGPTALIINQSASVPAYINMGTSTVNATTNDLILGPGCSVAYNISGKQYIAAITASGFATLQVSTGTGLPTLQQSNCAVPFTGTVTATPGPPFPTNPSAGTSFTLATGGTPQTIITGPVSGCYILNPAIATDQGISSAEVVIINGVTTAASVGNGTSATIFPGQTWGCVPGQTTNVSAVAATSGHKLVAVKW